MALLKGLTYQGLAGATGEKERVARFTLPPGSTTVLRRIRALRRVEALLAVPQARHWHQGRTSSFLTKAQKGHNKLRFQTHVLRRGVRDEQLPARSQTCRWQQCGRHRGH
eukprot:6160849-Pyramimonas_sp.AAC.1